MKKGLLYLLGVASVLLLSGCVARTYPLTRDRIDQDLSTGNRGYLSGKGPSESDAPRKESRTVRVFEIELGSPYKTNKTKTENTAISEGTINSGTSLNEVSPELEPAKEVSGQKYTVGKNDTLQKISQKFYGTTKKWTKIYSANKSVLKGPDKVYPGQVLIIPDISKAQELSEPMNEPATNLK